MIGYTRGSVVELGRLNVETGSREFQTLRGALDRSGSAECGGTRGLSEGNGVGGGGGERPWKGETAGRRGQYDGGSEGREA